MEKFNVDFDTHGVGIAHHFGGKAYAKETRIPAGLRLEQHRHSFDHLSILASGSVVVSVDGVDVEHVAPKCILIQAGKKHAVTALTDTVWFCVHGTECADPSQIDHELTHEKD
jgi:quercetin dioxygenase-like cupin family protein